MKAVLLRVGIDKGYGGILSPLFKDGTFELICIPEYSKKIQDDRTYSNVKGRLNNTRTFIDYFPDNAIKRKHENCIIHVDPEFDGFTYGDPTVTKGSLTRLSKGDYLIFYAGLQPFDSKEESGLYIVGYFEVDIAVKIENVEEYEWAKKEFPRNFHVMHEYIFMRDVETSKNKGLKIVRGTKNSRLLMKAKKISIKRDYKGFRFPTDILDPRLYKVLGDFKGRVSLMRNALRWIDEDHTEKAIEFITNLQ